MRPPAVLGSDARQPSDRSPVARMRRPWRRALTTAPRRTRPATGRATRLGLVLAPVLAAGLAGAPAAAQGVDSTVAVVQRMVNAGDRAGARQLADSALRAAREGTAAYAEALFARAFASGSAVEAERDYLRVAVEYALSPRAEDAAMMVAQLKLARGDRTGARRNFERLLRDHPTGAQVPKAAFWAGRLAVEDGDLGRGCQSLGVAKARARSDDVEFTNQVDYYLQRCTPSALAGAANAVPSSAPPSPVPAPSPSAASRRGDAVGRAGTRGAPRVRGRTASPELPPVPADSEPGRDSAAPPPAAIAPGKPAAPLKAYSVQVAAFPKQRDAEALAQVLSQRGFAARVWGSAPPFRVRVGRYATREDAEGELARMKAARLNGIVVEAEPQ